MPNHSDILTVFKELLETADRLMGPGGCPWDREQTLISMRSSVLEEACEVIEAIDDEDDEGLIEELGDLLYNVLFFAILAEKEGRFSVEKPIRRIREKLIARHPHVFGDHSLEDADAVVGQWEEIKKKEKSHRESLLDGIPKGLPALSRAYKMAGKMKVARKGEFATEEELGETLWDLCCAARARGIHPEHALRKVLLHEEKCFRMREKAE